VVSPSNKTSTPSDSNSVLFDYQNLINKLNELSVYPLKLKYQLEEFKAMVIKDIGDMKQNVTSKVKEIDSYVSNFHADL
jgi:hypothetical protein